MSSAKFYEQQATGIASHLGASPVVGNNQRFINFQSHKSIVGMELGASNTITVPPGTYKITASAPAFCGGNTRAIIWDFTNNVALISGRSQWSSVPGQESAKINVDSVASDTISVLSEIQVGVMHYIGALYASPGNVDNFGTPTGDGLAELYTSLEFEQV